MRRRISLLLAVMLANATLTLFGPSPPAGAVVACAGTGTATVAPGLLYPVLGGITGAGKDHVVDILIGDDNTRHGFSIVIPLPGCVHIIIPPGASSLVANGVLKGYCGHSSGTGVLNGQPFSYVSLGTFLILTGHVIGAASAVPAPGTGSCAHFEPATTLPSGAAQFLVTGASLGLNCTNALPPQELLLRVLDSDTLVIEPITGASLLGVHVHLGVHTWTTPICISQDVLL